MRKLPTKVKEMQGTLEKSRENPYEVEYSRCQGVPEAPEHMDAYGQRVWLSSAAELHEKQILFATDLPQLETYCEAAMLKRMALQELQDKNGEGSKNTRWNNWFKRWKDAATVMDNYSKKFGFSPVDKTNIAIPAPDSGADSLLK